MTEEQKENIEISNRIMTEKEKREINNQFIGYGDPESPVWIMGYEEGGEYNQEEFTDLNYFRKKDIIFRYNNSLIVPQKDENNMIIPDKYREPEPNSTYGGYKFMLEKLFPSLLSDGRFFIMNLWPYSKPFHQTNNNLPEYAREFLKFPLDWSYNQILANIREDRFNYLRTLFRTFNWKEKFIFFCVGHGLPNKDLESFLKSLYLIDCIPYSLDENVGKVLVDDYKMKFIGPHASTYGYYKNNYEVITIISELIRSNNYYVSLNM